MRPGLIWARSRAGPRFLDEVPGRAHEPTAVFANADVVTMDERHPLGEAVAVWGGRILAVGDLDGVLAAAGRSAHVVDLGGLT
jgi:predicted amidohydrolase YtcJ